ELDGILVLEFDADGRLVSRTSAAQARVDSQGAWTLLNGQVMRWTVDAADTPPHVETRTFETLTWNSSLTAATVAAAVLPLSTMTTRELWRYGTHLTDQEQASQGPQLRFWKQ